MLNRFAFLMGILALSFAPLAQATVWWPEVMGVNANLTVYRDYHDPLLFYYVPRGITVASTPDGIKMISHELFFSRLNPSKSATQYNLTFEPLLGDDTIKAAQSELAARFGGSAKLVPLPVTSTTFEVTLKAPAAQAQYSAPFAIHLPNWTGDTHSFQQRFTAVLIGNAYESEPAMSRFLINPASNGFAATMHYGFRGIQIPFKATAKINVHQFISKFKAHVSARYSFWASADVSTAIDKIKDDRSVFIDVVKEAGYESESWKSLVAKLIDVVFEPMPTPPSAPSGADSGFAFVKIKTSYESVQQDRTIEINLQEAVVKDHSGDIDITGGGVSPTQLSENLKYMCDMWARFDSATQACKIVCEPVIEFYNPTTKACQPAFNP